MKAVTIFGFGKVKAQLGFSHCKIIAVGTAAIQYETLEYFISFNIPLLECYGMSESTGLHTANTEASNLWRAGSCGRNIKGVETKIDHPDENGYGEVSDVR